MTAWREHWRRFAAQKPGNRFRDRHDRHQAGARSRAWWRKPFNIVLGLVSFAIGLVLTVAPGPGVVFFLIAGLFLGNESRLVAGILDAIDVRIAPVVHVLGRRWRGLSPRARRAATVGMGLGTVVSVVVSILVLH